MIELFLNHLIIQMIYLFLMLPNDISISDAETQSGNEHEPNENI